MQAWRGRYCTFSSCNIARFVGILYAYEQLRSYAYTMLVYVQLARECKSKRRSTTFYFFNWDEPYKSVDKGYW